MNGWQRHDHYLAVSDIAEGCLRGGRKLETIAEETLLLARLYSYGFRGHIIGAFHATAIAIESLPTTDPVVRAPIELAAHSLHSLSDISRHVVPDDLRAVIAVFRLYDRLLERVTTLLRRIAEADASGKAALIEQRFLTAINRVTGSPGIALTRDDEIPEQASFIVPSLGITIVPLVYGDQHSWNMAFLSGSNLNVPRHRHHEGAEIHLGMGALLGDTCLGGFRAEVKEGYAMPITAGTPHGFINRAGHDHRLPFIFGSKRLGGWGIFPDVEPQPIATDELKPVSREAKELNGTAYLDREIDAMARETGTKRRILLAPERTFAPQSGGLALRIMRVEAPSTDGSRRVDRAVSLNPERFTTVSVVRGRGHVKIGPAEVDLTAHDHFGIPAGARATFTARAGDPLVLLDAVLVEKLS